MDELVAFGLLPLLGLLFGWVAAGPLGLLFGFAVAAIAGWFINKSTQRIADLEQRVRELEDERERPHGDR